MRDLFRKISFEGELQRVVRLARGPKDLMFLAW